MLVMFSLKHMMFCCPQSMGREEGGCSYQHAQKNTLLRVNPFPFSVVQTGALWWLSGRVQGSHPQFPGWVWGGEKNQPLCCCGSTKHMGEGGASKWVCMSLGVRVRAKEQRNANCIGIVDTEQKRSVFLSHKDMWACWRSLSSFPCMKE